MGEQDLPQRRREPQSGLARLPCSEQLLGEERVAIGAIEDVGDQTRPGLRAEDGGDQRAEPRLVEPGELDAFHASATLELGEPRQQRMTSVELVGPVRADHDDGHLRERANEEGDRLARGRIRPVQVLEDQQDRRSCRESRQQPEEALEQP